jgi:hypothetical protein
LVYINDWRRHLDSARANREHHSAMSKLKKAGDAIARILDRRAMDLQKEYEFYVQLAAAFQERAVKAKSEIENVLKVAADLGGRQN